MNMTVILENGNLIKDSNGFIRKINNKVKCKVVSTFKEAQGAVKQYIKDHHLLSSTFTGGDIVVDGKRIAQVSYNGRVWKSDGRRVEEYGCYCSGGDSNDRPEEIIL